MLSQIFAVATAHFSALAPTMAQAENLAVLVLGIGGLVLGHQVARRRD